MTFEMISKLFDHIDFLKIDIEGKENSIFIEKYKPLFLNIKKISLEYHDYCSKISHQYIIEFLESLGFKTKFNGLDHIVYIYAKR
jgi:hypothetical protein